jgi:hypothetical protein
MNKINRAYREGFETMRHRCNCYRFLVLTDRLMPPRDALTYRSQGPACTWDVLTRIAFKVMTPIGDEIIHRMKGKRGQKVWDFFFTCFDPDAGDDII